MSIRIATAEFFLCGDDGLDAQLNGPLGNLCGKGLRCFIEVTTKYKIFLMMRTFLIETPSICWTTKATRVSPGVASLKSAAKTAFEELGDGSIGLPGITAPDPVRTILGSEKPSMYIEAFSRVELLSFRISALIG